MKYIKLYESFSQNIDDLLIEYIEGDVCKRNFINQFLSIYMFRSITNAQSAKERLESFNINSYQYSNYLVCMSEELIKYLHDKYSNLKEVNNPKMPFHDFYINQKGDVIFYIDKRNLEGWFASIYAGIIMNTFNINTYLILNNVLHYVANVVVGRVTTKVSIKSGLNNLLNI